jgi:uncharacterized protein YndB with AHSA1/START domain
MTLSRDPALDLSVSRIIKAPRAAVWNAWTDPRSFEQWWVPAPSRARVVEMDLRPGGGFVTEISEDGGDFRPHMSACFLAIDEGERIVFTTALLGGWRPVEQPLVLTALITMQDHPDGTQYIACAMHRDSTDRATHEELGFHDGWNLVIGQLARLVEA